jgi:malonate-semialdehyde dehydrogenase (acetylating)/methylmalonate-semialdehyde dehydrogenase
MIADAVDAGAEVVVDGRGFEHPELDGNFLGPTLLDGVSADMAIAREEIFGPVACLDAASDVREAVERINGSRFGNAATIYTERGGEARAFRRDVQAGNVGVNVGVCAPMAQFHFGGRKASFFGDLHAQGEDAVQFYTDKTVSIERWYE